jgi:invasion protein IalB
MKKTILLLATLIASTAVAHQQAAPPAPRHSAPSGAQNAALDPNEMICRSQAAIGSRLNRQRVCATRQQWLDQSRADRLLTEKAQTSRTWCKNGPC